MRRLVLISTLALAIPAASSAIAAPAPSFTLGVARATANHLLAADPHQLGACRWRRRGELAACAATVGPVVIANGTQPLNFTATVIVERLNPCRVRITRTGPHSGIASGVMIGPCDDARPIVAALTNIRQEG